MFVELVRREIEPVISAFGFKPADVGKESVTYRSAFCILKFFFDKREHSANIFAGSSDDNLVLLDDDILSTVFKSTAKIDQLPIVEFMSELVSFFQREGASLLSGDQGDLRRLLAYQEERSEKYTAELRAKQLRSRLSG